MGVSVNYRRSEQRIIRTLTPIHTAKTESAAFHFGKLAVFTLFKYKLTWSTNESTVGRNGVTRFASVVAPPLAKLYEYTGLELNCVA